MHLRHQLRRRVLTAVLPVVLAALAAVPAASAAANHQVVGHGSTAQFLCANGVLSPATTIDFNAQKSKGTVFGSFFISGPAVQKFGNLNDGTINESSYSVSGVTSFDQCGGVFFPTVAEATISGDCGTAVVIHYQDTFGQRGDFIGNVACS